MSSGFEEINEAPTLEEVKMWCEEMLDSLHREYPDDNTDTVCHFTEDKIWVDANLLDNLADEIENSYAKKFRKLAEFNIDSEGPYYYLPFKNLSKKGNSLPPW